MTEGLNNNNTRLSFKVFDEMKHSLYYVRNLVILWVS